jgi:hypothetical protein
VRITTFVREISRNLASGTSRLGLLAAVATVVLSVIILAEILTIAGLVRQGIEYRAGGAAVMTLALPGRIDGEACEALGSAADVTAAGALRERPSVSLTALPSSPLKQYVVTPHFPRVLGASESGEGAYFSDEVAEAVGQGDVSVDGRAVRTRGIYPYPADGRRAGFGWAMLLPTFAADGAFDECWMQVWPERRDSRQLLLSTLTPPSESASKDEPLISQLNTRFGVTFTGVQSYLDRPTRFASHAALAAGLFLALAAVWMRRVEIAANAHAGATRSVMTLQQVIEAAAWSIPAAACSWSLGCAVAARGAPVELASLDARAACIALAFVAGATAGAIIGTLAVREKQLWSYVKGR